MKRRSTFQALDPRIGNPRNMFGQQLPDPNHELDPGFRHPISPPRAPAPRAGSAAQTTPPGTRTTVGTPGTGNRSTFSPGTVADIRRIRRRRPPELNPVPLRGLSQDPADHSRVVIHGESTTAHVLALIEAAERSSAVPIQDPALLMHAAPAVPLSSAVPDLDVLYRSEFKDIVRLFLPLLLEDHSRLALPVDLTQLDYITDANRAQFAALTYHQVLTSVLQREDPRWEPVAWLQATRMTLNDFYLSQLSPPPSEAFNHRAYQLVDRSEKVGKQFKFHLNIPTVNTFHHFLCTGLLNPHDPLATDFFYLLFQTDSKNWGHCLLSCGHDSWNPFIKLAWAIFRANILALIDSGAVTHPNSAFIQELFIHIRFRCAPFTHPFVSSLQWRSGGGIHLSGQPAPPDCYSTARGFGDIADRGPETLHHIPRAHWCVIKRDEVRVDDLDTMMIIANGFVVARYETLVDSSLRATGSAFLEVQPYRHYPAMRQLCNEPQAHSIPIGKDRHPSIVNILPLQCGLFMVGRSKVARRTSAIPDSTRRRLPTEAERIAVSGASPTAGVASAESLSTRLHLLTTSYSPASVARGGSAFDTVDAVSFAGFDPSPPPRKHYAAAGAGRDGGEAAAASRDVDVDVDGDEVVAGSFDALLLAGYDSSPDARMTL